MKTFSERLAWARRKAGYENPQRAADAFGWNANTYKSHDNGIRAGSRGPSEDVVRRYARAFRVDWVWLMTGVGSPEAQDVARLAGRIGAGAKISRDVDQSEEIDIELPFSVGTGLLAFEVTGDSMWPKCDEGDVILCGREGTELGDVLGKVAAVQTLDGDRFFKRIERGSAPGLFNLESVNPNVPPLRDQKLEWAAAVKTYIPRGEWQALDSATRSHLAAITRRRSVDS